MPWKIAEPLDQASDQARPSDQTPDQAGQPDKPKRRRRRKPLPTPDALGYSLPDASAVSGLGRTKLYDTMADGRLQYVEVDGRRIINGRSLRRLIGAE